MKHSSVPIIDVTALRRGTRREQAGVVLDIGAAARDIGFFTIVGHGVSPALRESAFDAARRFFDLPAADKERLATDGARHGCGYSRLGAERLDPALPGDFKETFHIGHEPPAGHAPGVVTPHVGGPNRWPEIGEFRASALAYLAELDTLAALVQRAFALDLGMPPHFFAAQTDRPLTTLRMLRYPPNPEEYDGMLYGAGAHQDWGIFTLLAQDDLGGLEVQRRDGEWIAVDPVPDAFICNVGDCLMRWSNDRYMSRPHRVVNRAGRPRYSLAFFADPNPETLIACLPTCVDEDEPAKYPPISFADYQRERSKSGVAALTV
jgi:isopenicillin N synthase-like dioxygenase